MPSYLWHSGTLRLIAILEKKVFFILALLIILLFSTKVILSIDKILSERNWVTVFQKSLCLFNFFLINISVVVHFHSSQQRDTIIPWFRILFSIFIGPMLQKIITEFQSMHYCLGQFLNHKRKVITTNILFLTDACFFRGMFWGTVPLCSLVTCSKRLHSKASLLKARKATKDH